MKQVRKTQQTESDVQRNSELEEMTSLNLRGLIMNEANSLQYKQTNEGAFKCWRSIASCYQYAIPSKAPFPLMERHFPTDLVKQIPIVCF